ncbi:hypothetical protein [Mesobacillus maritimus]|uniref:Uncharacterized protein n=1 Tax=Mesobacillus maritimus TaxID=1643336 RepID=A0ABS7K4G6_9BACI|nr:hypothetical protein [Mesobacillus maritimus]MBY0097142.1 hypothetical protein [Mesobacillus maritimus]
MLLELTLYLIIGFSCLVFTKPSSAKVMLKDILFVLFWPYFILLKYVEYIDEAKQNSRKK